MIPSIAFVGLSLLIAFLGSKFLKLYQILDSTKPYRTEWVLISPKSVLHFLLPPIPYINLGRMTVTRAKYDTYFGKGVDIVSFISLLPKIGNTMFVADASAIREGATATARFNKPMEFYRHMNMFGDNILSSDGEQWKKYKKIASPSFNERNNRLVWDETVRIVREMFEEKWNEKTQSVVIIEDAIQLTFPLSLMVLISAGFGTPTGWNDAIIPEGHQMTFQRSVHVLVKNLLIKVGLPSWVLSLKKEWREVKLAGREVETYMLEMVRERQQQDITNKYDLLSGLIRASAEQTGDDGLTEREIMGNLWIFLFGGHETTANTLNAVFAYLALYPEKQQKLFEHIKSVLPEGGYPTYANMPSLTYTNAVIYETLRLYPVFPAAPRYSLEDTTMPVKGPDGKMMHIPVPKDTGLILTWSPLHCNPSYWEDPEEFKPERFLGDWPREAFLPFNTGPRSCPGRRFTETEMNAVVTTIISKYHVEITEDSRFTGETFEQKKERVLRSGFGLSLQAYHIPLTFHRRT